MAGGRTPKRLFFALAGGIDRIEMAERAVDEAESKVDRVRQEPEKAEQERDEAIAQLDAERNLHAYKRFEGAAGAAQAIGGFENIRQAMQTMWELLARTGEGEQEWLDVADFFNRFGKQRSYAASEDSEVKDLWSESNATQEKDEAARRIGHDEGDQSVVEEARALRWAFSPSREGALAASGKEGLEGVRQEARLAVRSSGCRVKLSGLKGALHLQSRSSRCQQKKKRRQVRRRGLPLWMRSIIRSRAAGRVGLSWSRAKRGVGGKHGWREHR